MTSGNHRWILVYFSPKNLNSIFTNLTFPIAYLFFYRPNKAILFYYQMFLFKRWKHSVQVSFQRDSAYLNSLFFHLLTVVLFAFTLLAYSGDFWQSLKHFCDHLSFDNLLINLIFCWHKFFDTLIIFFIE
jgi:hypothetical protein